MRQKMRKTIILISLLLFPVTLNFFSPYVSVDGAFKGIVSGSVLVFLSMFLTALFFRRAWCAWLCPVAGLSEFCLSINSKQAAVRTLKFVRYSIFGIWFSILVLGFILAGGIKGANPLHLTEKIISVDEPLKYITYYLVLFVFLTLSIVLGKRGACHSICWMSPFLTAGAWLGQKLHIPQLKITSEYSKCIDCKKCNQKCPMSIDVANAVKTGEIKAQDCILCGECIEVCNKKVLKYEVRT